MIKVPINFKELLRDQISRTKKYYQPESNSGEITKIIKIVNKFIEEIPYIYSNERNK